MVVKKQCFQPRRHGCLRNRSALIRIAIRSELGVSCILASRGWRKVVPKRFGCLIPPLGLSTSPRIFFLVQPRCLLICRLKWDEQPDASVQLESRGSSR